MILSLPMAWKGEKKMNVSKCIQIKGWGVEKAQKGKRLHALSKNQAPQEAYESTKMIHFLHQLYNLKQKTVAAHRQLKVRVWVRPSAVSLLWPY